MTLLLAGFIVFITHALEAVTGFGCTVLALPFVVYLLGMKDAVMLLAVLAWVLALYIAITKWRHIQLKQYLIIAGLAGVGLPVGMCLASWLPEARLKLALACFIVVAAVIQIINAIRPADVGSALRTDAPDGPHCGPYMFNSLFLPLGGIMHGAFASGGPLVVLYASKALPDKGHFRATLCLLWATLNTILMVSYARESRFTLEFGKQFATMLPFLLAGIVAGEFIHHRVNALIFRRTVFAVLLAVGIVMLISSLVPQ
jgi:uncharacterized membrane protein YfcA